MQDRYDVIVVGGGSAGCVAAARLSEDPRRRVLLLEAGPDPQPLPDLVAEARNQNRLLLESSYVTMYPTERSIDGSDFYSLAGRIMGGGSSVNVMAVVRPPRHDLDSWAARGNPGWAYDDLLPLMKGIEADQDYPDSPLHGSNGPLYIKRPFRLDMPASAPVRAFIDRAVSYGLPLCPDVNVPDPLGVGANPYNIKDGKRQSTAVAYLDPARARPNLRIVADALVTSLAISGGRVREVRYQKDGQMHAAKADQVALCAGVYHTPQILMLSGVGPASELKRLGIEVVQDLAGVGENYQDHAVVYMTFEGPSAVQEDWVVPRFRLIIKSDESRPCGNFHLVMRPPAVIEGIKRMMPISANFLEQRKPGRVRLVSVDPAEPPAIDPGMLDDPEDIRMMTSAMEFIFNLVQHDSMKEYYGPLLQPEPKQDWAHFARSTYDSYHHGAGTCKMGPSTDSMAVVDPMLRVRGIDNLWVADASIMPTVTHANTNLAVIVIAERLAELMKKVA